MNRGLKGKISVFIQDKMRWYSVFEDLTDKTLKTCWILMCVLLAATAGYNIHENSNLKLEVSKRRLLEASLQDLVVQSVGLRYIEAAQLQASPQARLQRVGYISINELIKQLKSRLQIVQALSVEYGITKQVNQLSNLLDGINKLALEGVRRENNGYRTASSQLDEWFITLGALNTYTKTLTILQEDRAAQLQRNNILLAFGVLLFSIGLVGCNLIKNSKLKKRFAFELSQMSDQARTDLLTGILNRRGWIEFTNKHLRKMVREGSRPASIAVLDIDYFKQYNDTFGHEAGDARLQEFAILLQQNFRPGDLVARVGGEEFAILLPNCTAEDAKRIVDRIRKESESDIGFSAGIAIIEEEESIVRTMAVADQALYQAKNKGRNQSCIGR